jgi:hypothetical protein
MLNYFWWCCISYRLRGSRSCPKIWYHCTAGFLSLKTTFSSNTWTRTERGLLHNEYLIFNSCLSGTKVWYTPIQNLFWTRMFLFSPWGVIIPSNCFSVPLLESTFFCSLTKTKQKQIITHRRYNNPLSQIIQCNRMLKYNIMVCLAHFLIKFPKNRHNV